MTMEGGWPALLANPTRASRALPRPQPLPAGEGSPSAKGEDRGDVSAFGHLESWQSKDVKNDG